MENDRESERARERARKGLEFMTNVEYENIHTQTRQRVIARQHDTFQAQWAMVYRARLLLVAFSLSRH